MYHLVLSSKLTTIYLFLSLLQVKEGDIVTMCSATFGEDMWSTRYVIGCTIEWVEIKQPPKKIHCVSFDTRLSLTTCMCFFFVSFRNGVWLFFLSKIFQWCGFDAGLGRHSSSGGSDGQIGVGISQAISEKGGDFDGTTQGGRRCTQGGSKEEG